MIDTGMSEKEKRMMQKLQDLVEKQRDAIRAKDHELMLRNEDVEAVRCEIALQQTDKNTCLSSLFQTYYNFPHRSSRCSSIG